MLVGLSIGDSAAGLTKCGNCLEPNSYWLK